MDVIESFQLSWRAIGSHCLRSVLTTLGIVIGVAAVILFVTLGASLQAAIVQVIVDEQQPSVTVTAAPQDKKWRATVMGGSPVFTNQDVARLRALPDVSAVYAHDPVTVPAGTDAIQPARYSDRSPPPTSQRRPTKRYARLTVEATSYQQLPAVRNRTTQYLRSSSDATTLKPNAYEFIIVSNEELVEQVNRVVGTFTTYITGVALLSWIVGSIGIANIMLVSVIERTRSIGIMKAVGAQNRDILQLFLTEAVVLGVGGAGLGTLVGGIGGALAVWLLDLPLVFRPEWAVFAVLGGIGVGILAGGYPALRAARTDPIEALRYE